MKKTFPPTPYKCIARLSGVLAIAIGAIICTSPQMSAAQGFIVKSVPTPHMKTLQLIKEGKKSEALVYINNYLKGNPNDPQMLFWKAKILNDSYIAIEKEEGFQLYITLSDNYPELAEPHNNLGVIYAAQGDYSKAMHYFELALRANPTYSIASENLADLYAQLAATHYKNAVEYDPSNKSARTKLEKINAKPVSPSLLSPPSVTVPSSSAASPPINQK